MSGSEPVMANIIIGVTAISRSKKDIYPKSPFPLSKWIVVFRMGLEPSPLSPPSAFENLAFGENDQVLLHHELALEREHETDVVAQIANSF